jgi:hypothetical protein
VLASTVCDSDSVGFLVIIFSRAAWQLFLFKALHINNAMKCMWTVTLNWCIVN